MKTRLLAILTVTVLSLLTTSYSYASLNLNNQPLCPTLNIQFTSATTSDNEAQNIANIQAHISYDRNTINIQVTDAYPNYEGYLTYTIKNVGNGPIQFTAVTVTNPNPEALQITTTNHAGTTLQPCQNTQGTTTMHVQPTAQQGRQYNFQIRITAQPKEPTHPRTATWWQNQFQAYLNRNGQPNIDAATLEQYLDQIDSQSPTFRFTGARNQKFQQAINILNSPTKANSETKLKAQLLALWLNQAAEWTTGYQVDGKTAQQIIQGSENALTNHQTSRYDYWRSLCERFNNLS